MIKELLDTYFGESMLNYIDKVFSFGEETIDTIFSALKASGIPWSYEVIKEEIVQDINPKSYIVTVGLYMPFSFKMGTSSIAITAKTKVNREVQIRKAIINAFSISGLCVEPEEVVTIATEETTVSTTIETNESNNKPKEFTKDQLNRMKQFKQDCNIVTNEDFMKFIHRWDSNATSKNSITPDTIESFLNFAGF